MVRPQLVHSLIYALCLSSLNAAVAQTAEGPIKGNQAVLTTEPTPATNSSNVKETTDGSSQVSEENDATTEKNTTVASEVKTEDQESEEQKKLREEKISKLIDQAEVQLYGDGVPVDLAKAAVLYEEAADLGSPKAMMRLASLYRKGTGVEKSEEKSFDLIKKAAEANYAPAQAALGISYLEGRNIEKNETLGYEWIEKAAENGHALSRVMAGERLLANKGNSEDEQKGKVFLDSVLENASPQELYTISYSFGHGLRLPKDLEKAKMWAKASSEKGSVNGTYYLGELYWNSNNAPEALKYFEKAAEMGLRPAELQTGRLYRDGADGIKKNPIKAATWLSKASDIANKDDLLSLVKLYLSGPLSIQSRQEAQKYLELYIKKTNAQELAENADKYWYGKGVRKNFDLGGALALASLQKDNKSGACSYAVKLSAPNWVKADPVTAYAVLNECILNKNSTDEEKSAFSELEHRMSAENLRKAQNLNSDDAIDLYLKENQPTLLEKAH